MESKKAKEFIRERGNHAKRYTCVDFFVLDTDAETAVEMAEKEMKEKAIEAHRSPCPNLNGHSKDECWRGEQIHKCKDDCPYMKKFIELLNK